MGPDPRILFGEGDIPAVRCPPRGAPRLAEQHQREQPSDLRLPRHPLQQHTGEPDRLGRQVPCGRPIRPRDLVPAKAVGGVDRLEHGAKASRQLALVRDLERNAGLADLGLGPNQPLAHGCRRHQECLRDARRVQAEHGLQHQRRVQRRVDRRVGADEEQLEALVGEFVGRIRLRRLRDERPERDLVLLAHARPPLLIDQPMAGCGEQPGLGLRRHALARPAAQSFDQGFAQSILGRRHVSRPRAEVRDESTVGGARHGLDRATRVLHEALRLLLRLLHCAPSCATPSALRLDDGLVDVDVHRSHLDGSRRGSGTTRSPVQCHIEGG